MTRKEINDAILNHSMVLFRKNHFVGIGYLISDRRGMPGIELRYNAFWHNGTLRCEEWYPSNTRYYTVIDIAQATLIMMEE